MATQTQLVAVVPVSEELEIDQIHGEAGECVAEAGGLSESVDWDVRGRVGESLGCLEYLEMGWADIPQPVGREFHMGAGK